MYSVVFESRRRPSFDVAVVVVAALRALSLAAQGGGDVDASCLVLSLCAASRLRRCVLVASLFVARSRPCMK
jgi:hypothetical protein